MCEEDVLRLDVLVADEVRVELCDRYQHLLRLCSGSFKALLGCIEALALRSLSAPVKPL